MKDNKEISFDILENSDINKLEEIGADSMMIDKSARDRMLKITNQKYKVEKEIMNKEQRNENISENEDAVTGVETYRRRGISRIIYTALCSAAALALVCGSIYMLSRKNGVVDTPPEPLEKASTTIVSDITVTASATKSTVSASKTEKTETTADTSAVTTDITTIETEAVTNNNAVSETEIDPKWITKYDSIDPAEATQEKLDAAFQRAMDKFMFGKNFYGYSKTTNPYEVDISLVPAWDIKADMRDINGDNVPELFISYDMRCESGKRTIMFIYDGNDFIAPTVKGFKTDDYEMLLYIDAAWMTYNQEDKCLYLEDKSGYNFTRKIKFDSDNSFALVEMFNYTGYYVNGELIKKGDDYIGVGNPVYKSGKLGDLPGEWMDAETLYADKNIKAEMYEENPYDYPGL